MKHDPSEGVTHITPVGGNIFADLGRPNAEELHTKLRLGIALEGIVKKRGLTQAETAKILGVNQPKVSALLGFKLEGFSVQRLMNFLTALEHDVVIQISPRRRRVGRVQVVSGPVRRAVRA
jgi:predicted XRE-type DNA-binding protein